MQLIFTALAILAFVVLTPTIFAVNTTVWGYITLAALFGVFLSLVAVILSIFSPILSRIPVVYEICCIPFSETCPKLSRILGTINFTLLQLIVISCCLYIRPVNSDTYRLPKIMYQTNDIVVVKNEEIKTIDYAYFEVKDKETREIYEDIVDTNCKLSKLDDSALSLYYKMTDGSTYKATKIKGYTLPKTHFWVLKSIKEGIKEIILLIYSFIKLSILSGLI